MLRWLLRLFTHTAPLAVGFALGVYFLPILTAPPAPDRAAIKAASQGATYAGTFKRDLKGSGFLHRGEGEIRLMAERIVHDGALSPGLDYKLNLVSGFVEDEAGFLALKDNAARVGDAKSFDGFILDVPPGVGVAAYTTAVVWCEAFSQFISAAKYRWCERGSTDASRLRLPPKRLSMRDLGERIGASP